MTHDQWVAIDREIETALGSLNWFHMKEGDHKSHPVVYNKLLGMLHPDSVLAGLSVSVLKKEYDDIMSAKSGKQPMKYWIGGPYTFLVQSLLSLCGEWCRQNDKTGDQIAYFFEAGHPSQNEADYFIKLFSKEQYKKTGMVARLASLSFLPKEGPLSRALILSDILAWHLTNWRRGGNQSPELQKLLEVTTYYRDYSADDISKLLAQSKQRMKDFDKSGKRRQNAQQF